MNGFEGYYDVYGCIPNPNFMGRTEDVESDDNIGATFGDDGQDGGNRRRNVRHTPEQIQALEDIYKQCTHPSGKQQLEIGRRLNLETKQIKFWFQNKRNQVKAHEEREKNMILRQENDLLAIEHEKLKKLLKHSSCISCSGPSNSSVVDNVVQQLQKENTRLRKERDSLKKLHSTPTQLSLHEPRRDAPLLKFDLVGENSTIDPKSLLALATVAMNELMMLGQTNSPLWRIDSDSKRETLNYEEYRSFFNNGLVKPPVYVMEASRETGSVLMDSLVLVKTLTTDIWVNVFAPIVSVASSHELIPIGSGGPKSGSLRLIEAEFQVISPLVPKRQVKFLRYCEMLREGLWVVVDFTPRKEILNLSPNDGSIRLPSGVIIENFANGHSKVTWIEQTAYKENQIPQLYQLLINSGIGLGAKRWLTTLQRHCQNVLTLSTINLVEVYQGLSSNVASEMVKLAQRMTVYYCTGITGSPAGKWERANVENERQNMRLMTRKNVNVRGEPTGIVLSAATSVWFPVSKTIMFDFLNNQSLRDKWDILTTDVTSIEKKITIQKSRIHGNYVSFFKNVDGISVLQETWNDASGALLVYAAVEKDSTEEIMRGENSDSVLILPSGFSILSDGGETGPDQIGGGCLLTLGYQFLVSPKPTANVDQDLVKEVKELMDYTIDNITSALSI